MRNLVLSVVASAIIALPAWAQKIALVSGEWAPYVSEKMSGNGAATEIVVAAARAAGLEPSIAFYPWARAEKMIETGEAFAAYPYVDSEERKKIHDFSVPILKTSDKFIYYADKENNWVWSTLAEFKKYRMGGTRGFWYMEEYNRHGITPVIAANDQEQLIRALIAGRIDYVVADPLVVQESVRKLFPGELTKIRWLSKPLKDSQTHLMVSRKHPQAKELMSKFNAGMALIRKNGSLAAILAKYKLDE